MKNYYRLILYLTVGLVIVLGLLAFLFRQNIQQFLHGQINQPVKQPIESIKPTAKEVVDLAILKSANFVNLKNSLVNFNFNDICDRAAVQAAAQATGGRVATRTVKCILGNSRPLVDK